MSHLARRTSLDLAAHLLARLRACGVEGPVVVGVSGGMDSAVLLDALVRAGVAAVGVHVHHGLRGPDADADAAHAQALCAARGVPFVLHRAEDAPASNRQAWGRALRYRVFAETARTHGAAWVATAHHADDQAETVLLALLRGTGVRGLSGMAEARRLVPGVRLVRPLLALPRAALRVHADAHGIVWREDASNADLHYRRAAIRHDVLPRLEALLPGAATRIAQAAAFVRAERTTSAPAWARLLEAAIKPTSDGGQVVSAALDGLPEAVRTGVLLEAARRFLPHGATFELALRLDRLLRAQVGRRIERQGVGVFRTRDGLAFAPVPLWMVRHFTPYTFDVGTRLRAEHGWLSLAEVSRPEHFPRDPDVAYFDAEALALPLTVRLWKPGDRLVPFGSRTPRRVSDLLTNAKVPPERRLWTCVVCDAHGEIVAVPGVRAGQTAPVTEATRRVLCLRFIPDAA